MWLLVASLVLLVLAIVVRRAHGRSVAAAREAQRRRLLADLPMEQLTVSGDVLSAFGVRGSYLGLDLTLDSHLFVKFPGQSETSRLCRKIEFSAPIDDMLVCDVGQVDAFMGPVPAVPATRTGDHQFDRLYSVFVSPRAEPRESNFRTTPEASTLAWARPQVLRQFLEVGPTYFRARGGRCEVVGEPLHAGQLGATLALCANIARAAQGKPLVDPPPARSRESGPSGLLPLWAVGAAAALGGYLVGTLVWESSTVRHYLFRSGEPRGLDAVIEQSACIVGSGVVEMSAYVFVSALAWRRATRRVGGSRANS